MAHAVEHGVQLERAPVHNFFNIVHSITMIWGRQFVDLAVPKSWANVWVRWEPLHGVVVDKSFNYGAWGHGTLIGSKLRGWTKVVLTLAVKVLSFNYYI
jgi:hypothetical protein